MEHNTTVIPNESNDINRLKAESESNGFRGTDSHNFKNIDLDSLKNIINLNSQGAHNTIHINVCDQQNIININGSDPHVDGYYGDFNVPAVTYPPSSLRLCQKTTIPQTQRISLTSDDNSQYFSSLNSFPTRPYPKVANGKYIDATQKIKYGNGEINNFAQILNEGHSDRCLEFATKVFNDKRKETEYIPCHNTFNDLSDGATEISRTYVLRQSPPETISITKSINQLPSLTTPKAIIGADIKLKSNHHVNSQPSLLERRRKTVAYNEWVTEKNRQFRRLSLPAGRDKSKNTMPDTLESLQYGKTYDQWKADKVTVEKQKRKEVVQVERERELKQRGMNSNERRQLIMENYNEWLKMKHDNELRDEENRTEEMRKKWAARAMYPGMYSYVLDKKEVKNKQNKRGVH